MSFLFKNKAFLCLIFSVFSVFGTKDVDFKKKILISQAALNLCKKKFEKAEGFLAGTLVKTAGGYRPIESLAVGDLITSFDVDGKPCQSKIVQVQKKTVKGFVALQIDEKAIFVGFDQRFFLPEKGDWIKAKNIALTNRFLVKINEVASASQIKLEQESADFYSISLDKYHNFCVTENDVLVHNLIPVAVGVTIAFDAGGAQVIGAFFSVGVAGFFLKLCGWQKNDDRREPMPTYQQPQPPEHARPPENYQPPAKTEEPNKNRGIDCALPIHVIDIPIVTDHPIQEPIFPMVTDDPINVGNDSGLSIFPIPEPDPDRGRGCFMPIPKAGGLDGLVLFEGPKAENMPKLLRETPLGPKLDGSIEKTHKVKNGQPIYRVTKDIDELGLKKGDHLYIDKRYYDEVETFKGGNENSPQRNVLNTDGTVDVKKTEKAIQEGRTLYGK